MTARGKLRGHEIEYTDGKWIFTDTREPTVETWRERPCGHCGKFPTPEGHDACLGILPGVMNACCGHGELDEAYVQYPDSRSVHGSEAVAAIEILKKRLHAPRALRRPGRPYGSPTCLARAPDFW